MKKHGDPGDYLVNFDMDGSTYGFVMYADNAEDAESRMRALRLTGKIMGGPCYTGKLPKPLMYLALPFLAAFAGLLNIVGKLRGDRK